MEEIKNKDMLYRSVMLSMDGHPLKTEHDYRMETFRLESKIAMYQASNSVLYSLL